MSSPGEAAPAPPEVRLSDEQLDELAKKTAAELAKLANLVKKTAARRGDDLPALSNAKEAAAYLGVAPRTLRRMLSDGRLHPVHLGAGIVRIRRAELLAIEERGQR